MTAVIATKRTLAPAFGAKNIIQAKAGKEIIMIKANEATELVATAMNNRKAKMAEAVEQFCESAVSPVIKNLANREQLCMDVVVPGELEINGVVEYIRSNGFEVKRSPVDRSISHRTLRIYWPAPNHAG